MCGIILNDRRFFYLLAHSFSFPPLLRATLLLFVINPSLVPETKI